MMLGKTTIQVAIFLIYSLEPALNIGHKGEWRVCNDPEKIEKLIGQYPGEDRAA
jgi:hypothetical protein